MTQQPFADKVAFITGSSRGIGFATARELGRQGAAVVLNARGRERLDKAHQTLQDEGLTVAALQADVASPDACRAMIDEIVGRFGALDILVNNAALMMSTGFETIGPEVYKSMVEVNVLGAIYATRFALPHLKARKGSVVFLSSIAGLVGIPDMSLYSTTKMALAGLASSLRCELKPDGVHVGMVYPGFTENDPEKRMYGPDGTLILSGRPPYHTQEQVAQKIATLIRKRKRQMVLTPYGKAVHLMMRISPRLVEYVIAQIQYGGLRQRLGVE